MSCMMLTTRAIAALAVAAVDLVPWACPGMTGATFDCLWLANAQAHADRYREGVDAAPAMPDVRSHVDSKAHAVRLLATVRSYRYNAADWRAFDGSAADVATSNLESMLIRCLPGVDGADLSWDPPTPPRRQPSKPAAPMTLDRWLPRTWGRTRTECDAQDTAQTDPPTYGSDPCFDRAGIAPIAHDFDRASGEESPDGDDVSGGWFLVPPFDPIDRRIDVGPDCRDNPDGWRTDDARHLSRLEWCAAVHASERANVRTID